MMITDQERQMIVLSKYQSCSGRKTFCRAAGLFYKTVSKMDSTMESVVEVKDSQCKIYTNKGLCYWCPNYKDQCLRSLRSRG